jgi:hypothetical protein
MCHIRMRCLFLAILACLLDWAATGEIAEPVVEALMFGGLGSGHYAFISQGRPLKVVGKNQPAGRPR